MHRLVFHILPKIAGLQAVSKPQRPISTTGSIATAKDKAGMQRNRTQHIFNHSYDRSRFSIFSSIPMTARSNDGTKLPSSTGQSVQLVAVLDAVLPSVAMIPYFSVALADAIQAPLAPKLSYASGKI
jgi:hypothetical protein